MAMLNNQMVYIYIHTTVIHSSPLVSGDAAAERRGHHVEVEAKLPKPPWQETWRNGSFGGQGVRSATRHRWRFYGTIMKNHL